MMGGGVAPRHGPQTGVKVGDEIGDLVRRDHLPPDGHVRLRRVGRLAEPVVDDLFQLRDAAARAYDPPRGGRRAREHAGCAPLETVMRVLVLFDRAAPCSPLASPPSARAACSNRETRSDGQARSWPVMTGSSSVTFVNGLWRPCSGSTSTRCGTARGRRARSPSRCRSRRPRAGHRQRRSARVRPSSFVT
jgi:hypothetical protein